MDFIISENQLNYILEQNVKSKITKDIRNLWVFSKQIGDRVTQKYKIDFKLLSTWGATVGGLVLPLDTYIRSGNFKLSDDQISLILFGCASTLIFDNERVFLQVVKIIKEEGILKTFEKIFKVAVELKESFLNFLQSLNVSVSNIVSLVRYSFLIPIIPDLVSYSKNPDEISQTANIIVNRILASGVLTISSELLSEIIRQSLLKLRR